MLLPSLSLLSYLLSPFSLLRKQQLLHRQLLLRQLQWQELPDLMGEHHFIHSPKRREAALAVLTALVGAVLLSNSLSAYSSCSGSPACGNVLP